MTHLARIPSLALAPLAATLLVGCADSGAVNVGVPCHGDPTRTALDLDEPGDNGHTPDEVLALASERLAEQHIRWDAYGAHPALDDTLHISFGEPYEAYDEIPNPLAVPTGWACPELSSSVHVRVPYALTSTSGNLAVEAGDAEIRGHVLDGELYLMQLLEGEALSLDGAPLDAALDYHGEVLWRLGVAFTTVQDGDRLVPLIEDRVVVPFGVGLYGRSEGHQEHSETLLMAEWIP